MLTNKNDERYTRDLRDPDLAMLLRDAYADDPALKEAPGRSERIMRTVLASGVRSAPRGFRWAPLAWATGSLATAAAALALMFMFMEPFGHHQAPAGPVANHSGPSIPRVADNLPTVPDKKNTGDTPAPPKVDNKQTTVWIADKPQPPTNQERQVPPHQQPQPPINDNELTVAKNPETPSAAPHEDATQVAAALYDAGSAAYAAGDYESAYNAYKASYDITPTPDTLLATGRALEQLANDELEINAS